MVETKLSEVPEVAGRPPVIADSVTDLTSAAAGRVIVTGSHGARASGLYALQLGVAAAVFNDAGIGLNDAGIRALAESDAYGVPAAAVSNASARVGDGRDTLASGITSVCNDAAHELGVRPGMRCSEAVTLLSSSKARGVAVSTVAFEQKHLTIAGHSVVVVDSASQIDESMACAIVVTGSHGGLVGNDPARALRHPVRFVAFNDAGGGKEGAGTARLAALEASGVPAVTVSWLTAEIGDGTSSLEHGLISQINSWARRDGAAIGAPLRDLVASLHPTTTH